MAKRKEVIIGLHNVFTPNADNLYDISTFSYEQSVDENTILFAIADSEDVGKYITINGEPRIISENDNFIITDGVVFSGNGGGSGSACNCGYRTVQTATELNTIENCDVGTVVYVIDEDKFYKYDGTNFSVLDLGGSHMLPAEVYTTITTKGKVPLLTAAVGFDDIKAPGVYFLGAGYNQSQGRLHVASASSENNYIAQSYTCFMYPNYTFTRTYTNSKWSEWVCLSNESGSNSYTGGTNIDITDNVISAKGYTYTDENNFYIGNETIYEEIDDITWNPTYPEEEGEPTQQQITYNGTDPDFDFNSIIKIGDFIRFFDTDHESDTIFKVINVNKTNFTIDGFWVVHVNYTIVERLVDGAPFLVKNDGGIYVKNIGDYTGDLNNITSSVSTLQDVINANSEAINNIMENPVTQITYTGGNNIHISNNTITAKGYSYNEMGDMQIDQSCEVRGFLTVSEGFTSNGYSTFNNSIIVNNPSTDSTVVSIEANSGKINAAGGFYETSDIRKKNVIDELPLDKAYELINNCQSIIYTLKDNTDKQQIGLIAQEVQQYFPEVVSENEDGYLSLDYAKLTSVIFRVLKDVIDRLNKLENK